MRNDKIQSFLFKCKDCGMILSIEFETKEDIKKVNEDKIDLECTCGGDCLVLRN